MYSSSIYIVDWYLYFPSWAKTKIAAPCCNTIILILVVVASLKRIREGLIQAHGSLSPAQQDFIALLSCRNGQERWPGGGGEKTIHMGVKMSMSLWCWESSV